MSKPKILFDAAVASLSSAPEGYCPEAYQLVNAALNHTLINLGVSSGQEKHVNGMQLSIGFRDYVLQEYGPMSPTMLEAWGLHRTLDIGKIVFQLIEIGFFSKSEHDRLEDFDEVFDFPAAFAKPFLPRSQASSVES